MKILFPKLGIPTEKWSVDVDKDIIDIYVLWYTKYIEIIQYISSVSTTLFIFSSTFVLSDFMNKNLNKTVKIADFDLFFKGLTMVFGAVVCSFICILATYNWLRSVIEKIKESSDVHYNDLINDNIYSDKNIKKSNNTRTWGGISWFFGWASGIFLVVGLAIYGSGVWKLVNIILATANKTSQ
jgi:hypothetical protein